ncbi:MAG TPA: NapC/NirT family cytochrome c [Candidatus Angelobacter sp.]|nr:NapC/NirT family cytochrome c [Candidatus Angelobacter sp.]
MRRLRDWLLPLVYLSNNWISLAGVVLVTAATVVWLLILPVTLRGAITHPYLGILVYLMLPGVFLAGLILIPIGIYFKRRRDRAAGRYPSDFPPLDFQNRELRKLLSFIVVTTFLNIVITSQFAYSAVNYMDTVSFCGRTCHTVMNPEFTAYQGSPHSRVECVNCHIGPGASWFVRSKLSGAGQVIAVMLHNYPTPIPVPVRNLRPARETCETCHWPQRFDEDRIRDIKTYAADESNTLTHTVLLVHIGGGRRGVGIHGMHLGEGVKVRYFASDEKRQEIPWVEYTSAGRTTVFAVAGARPDPSKVREMDCMDCHNRPTHIFQLPDRAMDQALFAGEISPTLPFAKKTGVEILKRNYTSEKDAESRIPAAFEDYYRSTYPQIYAQRRDDVTRGGQKLLAIFNRNVFPDMKISWGTYINNLGHTDFIGCFRCHDDQHANAGGKTITQDCSACHNPLATDEKQPKILTELGLDQP